MAPLCTRSAIVVIAASALAVLPAAALGDEPDAGATVPRVPAPKAALPKTASRAPAPVPKRTASLPVPASRAWHTVPPGKNAPVDASGRPILVLQGLNIPD